MDEGKLTKLLDPSFKLYQIKRAFWEERLRAEETGKPMVATRVYSGRMAKSYFYREVLRNHLIMAWIIQPVTEYEDKTRVLLDKAVERYDELISVEIHSKKRIKNADGDWELIDEFDPKKGLVLLQAIKSLEDRVKGASVQRQVSVHTKEPDGQGVRKASLNMDQIDKRLKEIQDELDDGRGGRDESGHPDDEDEVQSNPSVCIEVESRRIKGEARPDDVS